MRLIPLMVTLSTAILSVVMLFSYAADSPKINVQTDEVEKHIPTDWALLRFSDERKIRRAAIIMGEKGFFGPMGFQPNGETINISDRDSLNKIEAIFGTPPLRMADPDDGKSGGGWGTACFGRLEIETTDGKLFIGISFLGFHLNNDSLSYNNVFWSGSLARLIDDTYDAKYKKRITFKNHSLSEEHLEFAVKVGNFAQELDAHSKRPRVK